jgi:hypothetical protein
MKFPTMKDLKSYLDFKIDERTMCIFLGGLFIVGLLLYLYFRDDKKDDKKDDDKTYDDNQIDKLTHDKVIEVPDVKWPFLNLKDENNKNVNMLVIRGYLENNGDYSKQFIDYLNQGIKFIGCSSHQSFPRICDNPHGECHKEENIKVFGKDIEDYVLGWCHCFREPDKYIKPGIPKILISESDFNSENLHYDPNLPKIYDYITIQPKDNDKCTIGWSGHYKNWPLAEKCIQVLSDDLGLKGLIVGRDGCPVNIKNKDLIETTGFVQHGELMKLMTQSRFILLPNTEEASPRVLTESLTMNVPIFVNYDILGGWKYVNDKTGVFFTESTIKESATTLMNNIKNNVYSPREYYLNNHGLKTSGRDLRDFLKSINPDLNDCEYVRFEISSG